MFSWPLWSLSGICLNSDCGTVCECSGGAGARTMFDVMERVIRHRTVKRNLSGRRHGGRRVGAVLDGDSRHCVHGSRESFIELIGLEVRNERT